MAIYVRFSNEHVEHYLHSNVQMKDDVYTILLRVTTKLYTIFLRIVTRFFYEYISDVLIEKVIIMQNNVCT